MVGTSALQQIRKRDGRIVAFDRSKIASAILKAAQAVQGSDGDRAEELTAIIEQRMGADLAGKIPTVELIQDAIEKVLIEQGHARTAKAFILYRARRSRIREGRSELMETVAELMHADAASGGLPPSRLHAIGAAASREYYLNRFLPEAIAEAHLAGDMHIHGLAHYAKSPQAFVLPYRRLLERGFTSGHACVRPPRRAESAAALTALMLQAAHLDCHGGLVLADFDGDLAAVLPADTSEEALRQAMEALVHQLNAIPGAGEPPRVTIQIGAAEAPAARAVASALLWAVDRGLGRGEVALRPLVVVRVVPGADAAGRALVEQAAAVASRTPAVAFAFEDARSAHAGFEARLTGHDGEAGVSQIARATINLPRVALKARRAGGDLEAAIAEAVATAWSQLQHRHEALKTRTLAEFPFLMGQAMHRGAEGLAPADSAGPALAHGLLALGVVGLAEALVVLTGSHHGESAESQALGLTIIKRLAAHAARLSNESGLRVVLGATDAAGLGDRLARIDRREFGLIRGATETPSYTSGVAVPAGAGLAPEAQIAIEAAYAPYMEGGSFSQIAIAGASPSLVASLVALAAESGQRLLAFDLPLAHCRACGRSGATGDACAACGAPGDALRPVRRRRGYLTLEG